MAQVQQVLEGEKKVEGPQITTLEGLEFGRERRKEYKGRLWKLLSDISREGDVEAEEYLVSYVMSWLRRRKIITERQYFIIRKKIKRRIGYEI